jgi:BirA family biotin operon repressor/biotin-[acetyl-CoA-carboxylase] ligase
MDTVEYYFTSLDSTNNWAKEHASSFEKNTLSVIVAEEQTHGRARGGEKSWTSPIGNLYISFAFQPKESSLPLTYSHMAALAVQTVLQAYGIDSNIKWPNDIFVNDKKIAGILTETHEGFVIVGIGLNVNMSEITCAHIPKPATSMQVETHQTYDLDALQKLLQNSFVSSFDNISSVSSRYQEELQWMIGKTFSFTNDTGKVVGFDANGALFLEVGPKIIKKITA